MADREREHLRADLDRLDRLIEAEDPVAVAQEGIGLAERVLAHLRCDDDPELWARVQHRLARFAMALGYDRSRLGLLRRSIAASRAAQTVTPRAASPDRWARLQHNLALATSYLAELEGDVAAHGRAVCAFEAAVAAFDEASRPADRALTVNSLGSAHLRFGVARQDEASVAAAAACYEAALDIWSRLEAHEEAAMATYNLGLCHSTRGELTGIAVWYDRAIAHFDVYRAMMDRTRRPREWANASNAIAMALSDKGELAGDAAMVATAVGGFETILETMTRDDHPAWWAMVTINLCRAEMRLGELRGDPGGLLNAAERAAAALEVATQDDIPTYWTALTTVRADARLRLGRRLGDTRQLRRAADELDAIVDAPMRTPADRASAAHLRGSARLLLGRLDGDPAMLSAAMADFATAFAQLGFAAAPVPWAQALIGRADAARELGARQGDAAQLADALADYAAVLAAMPAATNPLQRAAAARGRGEAGLALWAFDGSDATAVEAERDFAEAQRLLDPALDQVAAVEVRRGCANAALLAGRFGRAARLAEALLADAAAMLAAETMEHERLRLADALTGVGDIAVLARCRLGHGAAALAAHDRGRAHRLRERLRISEAALGARDRHRLEAARRGLEAARRALAAALEAGRAASAIARLAAIVKARHEAFGALAARFGLTSIAPTPSAMRLRRAAADGAIAAIAVTAGGGVAIVVTRAADTPGVVLLPALTARALDEILTGRPAGGWRGAYRRFRDGLAGAAATTNPAGLAAWNAQVDATLGRLWEIVMRPLDRHLRGLGLAPESEIVLVPGGRLAALPLHAAGTGEQGFLDHWAVTYAPSLSARLACWRRAAARADGGTRLLAVTDPDGDLGIAHNPALDFFAPRDTDTFAGAQARRAAVMDAVPRCTHASFFTHAWWDSDHPEQSHIQLAGRDRIEARDFAELDLKRCRLVVLGACESGVAGTRTAPDEFQGLPASLIQAGVPGVLATLWPVFDRSTSLLLHRFFEAHMRGGVSPPVALRRAQVALRNPHPGPPAPTHEAAPNEIALGLRRGDAASSAAAREIYDHTRAMFWAAFAYSGA